MAYNNSTIKAAMDRSLKIGSIEHTTVDGHNVHILGEIATNGYYVLRFFGKRNNTDEFFIEIEILGTDVSTIRSYLKSSNSNEYEAIAGLSAFDIFENYYTESDGSLSLVEKSAEFDQNETYFVKRGFKVYLVPYTDILNGNRVLILIETSNPEYEFTNCELDVEYALKEFRQIRAAYFPSAVTALPETHLVGYFNTAHYESDVSLEGNASITAERIATPELIAGSLSFATENIAVEKGLRVGTLSIAHLHTDSFQTENIAANSITTPVIKIANWEIAPENSTGDSLGIYYRS